MNKRWLTITTLLLLSCAFLHAAPNADSLVEAGNKFYMNKAYDKAITTYSNVLSMGYHAPELYYNLGNAHYKSGDVAKAILNYERALQYDPNNPDYLHNLEKARINTVDRIDAIPEFIIVRWLRNIILSASSNSWALVSVLSFIAMLAAFLVYLFSQHLRWKRLGFVFGILLLMTTIIAFLASHYVKKTITHSRYAIVMSPTVRVKGSPDRESKDLFILHEGTKSEITDSVGIWFEIKLADGKKGWILKNTLEKI
jgi:tetratricopeptide (TPR) repeat protein